MNTIHNNKGFVFPIVLAMMLLLTTAGISYIEIVNNEFNMARRQGDGMNALYAAESGAESGITLQKLAEAGFVRS